MTSTELGGTPGGGDKVIVALDVATEREALHVVKQLRKSVWGFKVGLQLFTAVGPDIVPKIADSGSNVFLDLKLHDIPNTVEHAVTSAAQLGAHMLTVHLSGGEEMIRAAVTAAKDGLLILGVTVLTSHTQHSLRSIGLTGDVEEQVLRLAQLGRTCGVRGFVASAREATALRKRFGSEITIVTPGIRSRSAATNDQKRVTTPRAAIDAGADYLVIGRPIIANADPAAALHRLAAELQSTGP